MARILTSSALRTVDPSSYGFTAAEAKLQSRISTSADDTLVAQKLAAAGEAVQGFLGMSLLGQTWQLRANGFPADNGPLDLPYGPVLAVSSVTYLDSQGVATPLDASAYQLQAEWPFCRLWPAFGRTWPGTPDRFNAVVVVYTAGWHATDTTKIPPDILEAVLLAFGSAYANREESVVGTIASELPVSAQSRCRPWRAPALGR